MNFNIYISEELGKKIELMAHQKGKKRNTLIREAIEKYVSEEQQVNNTWPHSILNFQGIDIEPFEESRKELSMPNDSKNIFE